MVVAKNPQTNLVAWVYPPGASNFCWTLQGSSNMVDWQDIRPSCATDPLVVFATNGFSFFRLKASVP